VKEAEELPPTKVPSKIPTKIPPPEAKAEVAATTATKVFTDEQMFNLIERVNYLRKEAKVDLDNRDRESAYKKIARGDQNHQRADGSRGCRTRKKIGKGSAG
jgi:hypothetical protein